MLTNNNNRSLLTQVAPTLIQALHGPLRQIAIKFFTTRLDSTNMSEDSVPEEFLSAFLTSSENLHIVQKIEQEFKTEMDELNIDVFNLETNKPAKIQTASTKNHRPQLVLSVFFIVAYFMVLAAMFWAEVNPGFNPGMYKSDTGEWIKQGESLIDLFQILLGVLTAGVAQILNYWFGGRVQNKSMETQRN